MLRARYLACLAGALALFGACKPEVERPGALPFLVVGCDQDGGDSVRLNEALVIRFSDAVDPGTVRPGTLDVARIDSSGRPVPGPKISGLIRISGRGNVVRFLPRVPIQPDLRDGGFLPGERYRVRIGGFPRPDGIRSLDGRLLQAGARFEFRVVEAGRVQELFEPVDVWPGDPLPRIPSIKQVLRDDRAIYFAADAETWLLVFDTPLRPDHLDPPPVRLVQVPKQGFDLYAEPEDWPADALIPVRLRLLRASEAIQRLEEVRFSPVPNQRVPPVIDPAYLVDGCVLEIRPRFLAPPKPDSVFFLYFDNQPSAEGVRPIVAYSGETLLDGHRFLVVQVIEYPGSSRTIRFDFLPGEDLRAEDSTLGLVPADGILRTWEGVARSVLPAEAGTGEDGELTWDGRSCELEPRPLQGRPQSGWHLVRFNLPENRSLKLVRGTSHVSRTQGRLHLRGVVHAEQPVEGELDLPASPPLDLGLSATLDWLQEKGVPHAAWVAGGELVIEGEVELPGRVLVLASSNRLHFGRRAGLGAAAIWVFAPQHPLGLGKSITGRAISQVTAGGGEWSLHTGRFDWENTMSPAQTLVFRAMTTPVGFGDLNRAFDPQAVARFQLARGREAGVRPFIQIGSTQGIPWLGPAQYLDPDVPLSLDRAPSARVGLEIELFPPAAGEEGLPSPEVDRLEVILR